MRTTLFISFFTLLYSLHSYPLYAYAQDVELFEEDKWGNQIGIHEAVSRGDIQHVRNFIINSYINISSASDINKSDINGVNRLDERSNTLLHVTCNNTRPNMEDRQQTCQEIISMLIRAGADVHAENNNGETPLYNITRLFVTNLVPFQSVLEVVQEGADVGVINSSSGDTILHSIFNHPAKAINHDTHVEEFIDYYLLQEGVDINARNNKGQVPLDFAALDPRPAVVSHLLEKGADVTMANESLHNAVKMARRRAQASFEIASRLLEAEIDVDGVDDQDRTPLHIATNKMSPYDISLPVIFLLIQHGADIHATDRNGWTPFLQMANLAPGDEYDLFMQFLEWWPSQVNQTSDAYSTEEVYPTRYQIQPQ